MRVTKPSSFTQGSANGLAQVALSVAAYQACKQATIFVEKRSSRSPRTIEAASYGARGIEVEPGYLNGVQARRGTMPLLAGHLNGLQIFFEKLLTRDPEFSFFRFCVSKFRNAAASYNLAGLAKQIFIDSKTYFECMSPQRASLVIYKNPI